MRRRHRHQQPKCNLGAENRRCLPEDGAGLRRDGDGAGHAVLGIKMVGWHIGPTPGPVNDPPVFTNVTTDPREVAKAAAFYAVVDSNGAANVVLFKDSITTISTAKTNTSVELFKGCAGCKVLEIEDTPMGDLANRM